MSRSINPDLDVEDECLPDLETVVPNVDTGNCEHFDLDYEFIMVDEEEPSALLDESGDSEEESGPGSRGQHGASRDWPNIPTAFSTSRLSEAELYAHQWIADCNRKYPVASGDESLARFRHEFKELIVKISVWAKVDGRESLRFDRENRAMAAGFINHFLYCDLSGLQDVCLDSMPLIAQKVLGSPDLEAADLLDLPRASPRFYHRATYADVACRVPSIDVIRCVSGLTMRSKLVKGMRRDSRDRLRKPKCTLALRMARTVPERTTRGRRKLGPATTHHQRAALQLHSKR